MTSPIIISIKKNYLSKLEQQNIKIYKPFGIILFARNISNFNQVRQLTSSIKSLSKKTLIFIDQEGGIVNRFKNFSELQFKNNFDFYDIYLKYPSLAKQLVYLKSFITNYYLSSLDIDVNTIPVLDIPNSKTVSMIKKRTFGSELKINTILTDISVQSSLDFGVMPVMKHFPGHGLTNKDSHFIKPVTNASTKVLNHQLSLFKTFIKLPMIMTAHIQYQNWDNHNIATFSPYILKDILRKKLKYKGLVMSDDLVMKANNQSIEKSIDLSNKSGLDIILDCSSDWKRYIKILENFKKTNFFNNKNKILFSKKTSNRRLQSININHYHDLYNELIKLYGI
tara:strand:- start:3055 stop:4068 length:1014 start_codon:yes stop_codon:yes gene_type:complete